MINLGAIKNNEKNRKTIKGWPLSIITENLGTWGKIIEMDIKQSFEIPKGI